MLEDILKSACIIYLFMINIVLITVSVVTECHCSPSIHMKLKTMIIRKNNEEELVERKIKSLKNTVVSGVLVCI